jgi:hypothetical protein
MSNVVITLGGVPLQDMEVPERIYFGGGQRVAVQQLIGGGRVVQALGLDDGSISFSGIFSGTDAVRRAQLLDGARALGAPLPLVWGEFFYTVIIAEFSAVYHKANLIPFTVCCVVVSDPLASLVALGTPLAISVGNDLNLAAALSGQAGFSLDGLSAASLAGFSSVQNIVQASIGNSGAVLQSSVSNVNGAADAASGIDAVDQASGMSRQLAALTRARGYVNRAAANLAQEFS